VKTSLTKSWPLYASVITFLLLLWLSISVSVKQNQGHFIYAGDDPYIGMAVARNFAQYGVWGVTRYGFTSSSSTISWTLLLSLTDYLVGPGELAPLGWNLVFAILLLAVAYAILVRYRVPPAANFAGLLGIIFLLPLPALVLSGMEHTLQTLLSVLTVFLAARLISNESPGSVRRDTVGLLLLAPLVTSTRFEGMFIVAAVCGLCLLVKRWRFAVAFAFCGFLPVVIHGVISVRHGWFWFPASVLMKATLPNSGSGAGLLLSLINPVFVSFREGLHTLALLIAVLLVYIVASGKGSVATESRQIAGAMIVFLWLTHVEFVGEGPLYRYDFHLCALSILFVVAQLPVIASEFPQLFSLSTWSVPRNIACGVLGLILFFPQAMKGGRLLWFLPRCTTNIYEQQYQMGLFVSTYYQGATVALNDIGAVNYLADIHCLDLMGLANSEVARAKRKGDFEIPDMQSLVTQTGARIAIIYDNWFPKGLPPAWIRVGRWTIPSNVIDGGDTVSFYAVNPSEAPYLAESLTGFSPRLPREVLQRGH
jgi:hypothetical protein